jgi:hypothetical protein
MGREPIRNILRLSQPSLVYFHILELLQKLIFKFIFRLKPSPHLRKRDLADHLNDSHIKDTEEKEKNTTAQGSLLMRLLVLKTTICK